MSHCVSRGCWAHPVTGAHLGESAGAGGDAGPVIARRCAAGGSIATLYKLIGNLLGRVQQGQVSCREVGL